MASQEERDNFFSLTLLLFRVGNQRLREYFKAQWPIVYQRVRPGTVPPPWQDTPHDATVMKNIQPRAIAFKYKDERTKFDSGNTNDWDFSMLTTVLRYSSLDFVLPSSLESKALDDLKAIRNKLIGHATDAAIPNAVFNSAWTDACNALKQFNATAADFKSVQDDVKKPLDVLFPMLQQCIAQEKDIQNSVDTIINRLEQLHKKVEQQHTTQLEAVGSLKRKVDQLLDQEHQSRKRSSAEAQPVINRLEQLHKKVEQQHTTQIEAVGSLKRKVDQLLDQELQSQKRPSVEAQPGKDDVKNIPGTASKNTERNYTEDSEKLKRAIKSNTECQTKFMAAHDVPAEKTDIFTNLTVYYQDKKQVNKEQTKGLSRTETLQEYTKRETGVKVDKYQDIFIGMKGSKKPNLLLTGKPGIGKTFFCEKVIRDWSMNRLFQNVENNQKIQFAYLLKFRQLSSQGDKELNLQDLLNCSPLLDDNSKIDESLFEYLTQNPSEVLIILDGFDEYSLQHREQIASDFEENYPNGSGEKMPIPALCSKLIRGKLLKDSVVLVSSRPGEAEELGGNSFDRFVEISGFSPEQVNEYVDKYFSEPEKQQAKDTVRKHVLKNENLVSFCHIPLLSFLLCWCLEWRFSQSGITENLPAKITDLYDEVVKVVVQKLHANLKNVKMSRNTLKKAQETLGKLSKLAANLLMKSLYIFDEEDMKNMELTDDEIENLKVSGILHCIPGIRISAFQMRSEFTFIHLTLQEYLSASFFGENKKIPEKEKVTGQTLVFMSGLFSREKDRKLMEKLIQQITPQHEHDYVNKLQLLQCLYEYGDDELTKLTINNQYDKYCYNDIYFSFTGVSDVDVKCLSYFLDIIRSLKQQHPQSSPGHRMRIFNSSLTSFGVGIVCESLVRNSFIAQLWLDNCSLDDKCVEKITDFLVNTRITHLDLSFNNLTDKEAESICRVFIRPDCHVEWLYFTGNNNLTEECKKILIQFVQKHKPGVYLIV